MNLSLLRAAAATAVLAVSLLLSGCSQGTKDALGDLADNVWNDAATGVVEPATIGALASVVATSASVATVDGSEPEVALVSALEKLSWDSSTETIGGYDGVTVRVDGSVAVLEGRQGECRKVVWSRDAFVPKPC